MNSTSKADVGHYIQHRAHQAANLPPNLDYGALLVLEGLVPSMTLHMCSHDRSLLLSLSLSLRDVSKLAARQLRPDHSDGRMDGRVPTVQYRRGAKK